MQLLKWLHKHLPISFCRTFERQLLISVLTEVCYPHAPQIKGLLIGLDGQVLIEPVGFSIFGRSVSNAPHMPPPMNTVQRLAA